MGKSNKYPLKKINAADDNKATIKTVVPDFNFLEFKKSNNMYKTQQINPVLQLVV